MASEEGRIESGDPEHFRSVRRAPLSVAHDPGDKLWWASRRADSRPAPAVRTDAGPPAASGDDGTERSRLPPGSKIIIYGAGVSRQALRPAGLCPASAIHVRIVRSAVGFAGRKTDW